MANAKQELNKILDKFDLKSKFKNAVVEGRNKYDRDYLYLNKKEFDDLDKLLDYLDFEYNEGYGGQELYGIVVFVDGSWLERGEYDGAEWWEYKKTPSVKNWTANKY